MFVLAYLLAHSSTVHIYFLINLRWLLMHTLSGYSVIVMSKWTKTDDHLPCGIGTKIANRRGGLYKHSPVGSGYCNVFSNAPVPYFVSVGTRWPLSCHFPALPKKQVMQRFDQHDAWWFCFVFDWAAVLAKRMSLEVWFQYDAFFEFGDSCKCLIATGSFVLHKRCQSVHVKSVMCRSKW